MLVKTMKTRNLHDVNTGLSRSFKDPGRETAAILFSEMKTDYITQAAMGQLKHVTKTNQCYKS